MSDRVHGELSEHRAALISDLQSRIMDEFNESRLGSETDVLIEGYDKWGECWFGRSYAEAPDVDGKIFVNSAHGKELFGKIIRVKITDVLDGDLIGEIIGEGARII
jgi:ribosomal protein S12 methylthiotransferase